MKTALTLTYVATFIYLAVGIAATFLSKRPGDIWGAGFGLLVFFVGIPWALFGLFKLLLLVIYHIGKTWREATQDVRK